MKAKKSKGKPATNRAKKDLSPKKTPVVKGGSSKIAPKAGDSSYEGSRVVTYNIENAWPK